MFIYFSRLYQKHRCRVVPIAVFTYPEKRNEPDRFKLAFPFMSVLDFHFLTLELNKHKWQDYIQSKNPVAAALLSKMGYQKKERVQVKLEFLRMLVRMELDPARMTLLTGFFETYLILNEEEERKLEEEMGKVDEKEAKRMIEITTSWEEKGRVKGQASILLRQLKKKFGHIPVEVENKVMTMPIEKLQDLAEAIFDLGTLEEVDNFINR